MDWLAVADRVRADATSRGSVVHGETHWWSVASIGRRLAQETPGADAELVVLFGLLHDCQRVSDGGDPDHGRRAAAYARRINAEVMGLDDRRLVVLCEALAGHSDGGTSADPTIGVCWDADRLDLVRLLRVVDAGFLSTEAGRLRRERPVVVGPVDWATGGVGVPRGPFYHGGAPDLSGLIVGADAHAGASMDFQIGGPGTLYDPGRVYFTAVLPVAALFAWRYAWLGGGRAAVYEVEPLGDVEADPDFHGQRREGVIAMSAPEARVIRVIEVVQAGEVASVVRAAGHEVALRQMCAAGEDSPRVGYVFTYAASWIRMLATRSGLEGSPGTLGASW